MSRNTGPSPSTYTWCDDSDDDDNDDDDSDSDDSDSDDDIVETMLIDHCTF